MSKIRKYTLSLSIFLLLSCGTDKPIRIAFVATLSGRASGMGIEEKVGVEIAIDEINSNGGIQGHPIELIIKDDEGNQEKARIIVSELIQDDKVEAIIGLMTSSMTMSVMDIINENKTVLISPTSSTESLTAIDDYFFRTTPVNSTQAAVMAEHIQSTEAEKIAVLYDELNESYSLNWAESLKESFLISGGKDVRLVAVRSGEIDLFGDSVNTVLSEEPDALILVCNSLDAALIAHQIRKMNKIIPVYSSNWAKTNDIIINGGLSVEGMVFTENIILNSEKEKYVRFKETFFERSGYYPSFPGIQAYEAVIYLSEGLKHKEKLRHKLSLKEALSTVTEIQGLQNTLYFDEFGEITRSTYIVKIENGEFISVSKP